MPTRCDGMGVSWRSTVPLFRRSCWRASCSGTSGAPSPGNVREIENAIEYAVAVGRGQTIQPEDLPIEVANGGNVADALPPDDLRAVLERHHWRRMEAAKSLGMSRTTLWRRMREAGLA